MRTRSIHVWVCLCKHVSIYVCKPTCINIGRFINTHPQKYLTVNKLKWSKQKKCKLNSNNIMTNKIIPNSINHTKNTTIQITITTCLTKCKAQERSPQHHNVNKIITNRLMPNHTKHTQTNHTQISTTHFAKRKKTQIPSI